MIRCQSCEQPKDKLVVRKSKIMPDMALKMCNMCIDSNYEPRWLVILVGRSKGFGQVEKHITKRLYLGEEILASELSR